MMLLLFIIYYLYSVCVIFYCGVFCEQIPGLESGEIISDLLPNKDSCGGLQINKISGGERADLLEFPWMALLEYDKPRGRDFQCGGVLISRRYVLTAAHCIKSVPETWKLISVRLGEHDLKTEIDCDNIDTDIDPDGTEYCADPPLNVPVEEAIVHPLFHTGDLHHRHDIALLRLSREVTFTDFVQPICLPSSSKLRRKCFVGVNMTVAGWGRTENGTKSNVKLKLQVPVKSNTICTEIYNRAKVQLDKGQFCAGGFAGQDSCSGDSGGPLMGVHGEDGMGNWYVFGVVSFGPSPCGKKDWPSVYTNVTTYVNWIYHNMSP